MNSYILIIYIREHRKCNEIYKKNDKLE